MKVLAVKNVLLEPTKMKRAKISAKTVHQVKQLSTKGQHQKLNALVRYLVLHYICFIVFITKCCYFVLDCCYIISITKFSYSVFDVCFIGFFLGTCACYIIFI